MSSTTRTVLALLPLAAVGALALQSCGGAQTPVLTWKCIPDGGGLDATPAPDALPPATDVTPPDGATISGFFDLHTHPLSNLGFAGKLVYGGPDVGALLPADPACNPRVRAASASQALGRDQSTHANWSLDLNPLDVLNGKPALANPCGDLIRQLVVSAVQSYNQANNPSPSAVGDPTFEDWPKWDDITHQSMWVDWIKRTHDAGLSVMVALAVNNETLADAVAGPGDGPDDDMRSADLQIDEIKAFAARHPDWVEIAYSSADLRRIVYNRKLALVLGLEVDNIGDFNRYPSLSRQDITSEIARLREKGVRYLFPVHLIDNPFGTTAAYQDIFNLSNLREAGHFWNLVCAQKEDQITYTYKMGNPLTQTLDLDVSDPLTAEMAGLMVAKLGMLSDAHAPPTDPSDECSKKGVGMVNRGKDYAGLSPNGQFAIREMMRQGMLIDVDHMSQASVNDALGIAAAEGYPVNSGHNQVRGQAAALGKDAVRERSLTAAQYAAIGKVHGMAGVGGARTDDSGWVAFFQGIAKAMGAPAGAIGFGTDADGLAPLMKPPPAHRVDYTAAFPKSTLGSASWDYNTAGVAHYGLLADFVQGIPRVEGGGDVVPAMKQGAQYFYDTWKRAEDYAARQAVDAGAPAAAAVSAPAPVSAPPACTTGTAACPTPHRSCEAGEAIDRWGYCVPTGPRRTVAVRLRRAPTVAAPSLGGGEYTLLLEETAPAARRAQPLARAFDVDVATAGRQVTLKSRSAKPPAEAPKVHGGFRGDRFILRIEQGDHVMMLNATGPSAGTVSEVTGAYTIHLPGQGPLTGVFVLKRTSTFSERPAAALPFEQLGSFLTDLRK
ncbi:MAG TPA: membrane dipeptidase [Polyangiaceae bacterium]|nr:membrane dipeptidase [Polyangiaceae bacterium]